MQSSLTEDNLHNTPLIPEDIPTNFIKHIATTILATGFMSTKLCVKLHATKCKLPLVVLNTAY